MSEQPPHHVSRLEDATRQLRLLRVRLDDQIKATERTLFAFREIERQMEGMAQVIEHATEQAKQHEA